MNEDIIITGEKISPGSKREISLKISEFYTSNPVYIPVIVAHGVDEGPKIFITAAIHGNEINGVEIVGRLSSEIDPGALKGSILFVPIVNIFGFYTMQRNTTDRRNLNSSFPGIEKGTPASRIAYILFEEIIKKCDYGIDLHTPRENRYEYPHVKADLSINRVHQLARSFGSRIIINTPGDAKTLRHSANEAGIPTIGFFGGEVLRFHDDITISGVTGLKNVLSGLGMIDHQVVSPKFSIIVKKNRSILTNEGGILYVFAKPGTIIYKGDQVAKVTNPFGQEIESIYAPETGLVISASTNPLVNPGNEVCSYVMLDKSLGIVENAVGKDK